jgi:hypothetical protein
MGGEGGEGKVGEGGLKGIGKGGKVARNGT